MPRVLVLIGVTAIGLAACGGGRSDKAGGARVQQPTVLTMAAPNDQLRELQVWVDSVKRISKGRIVIHPVLGWRAEQTRYERGTIADVKTGKADLGWVGARAWTELGVHGLDAFNAPFAITNYEGEVSLVRSPLAGRMIATVRKAGVVGVAILPGPLRYLLTKRPVSTPADLRGSRIAVTRSAVTSRLVSRLGATTELLPSGAPISASADGVEAQLVALEGNGDGRAAKHLLDLPTGPRPFVVFANPSRWKALSASDQTVLAEATKASIAPMAAEAKRDEAGAFQRLCGAGVETTAAQTGAFRAAARSVVRELEADPLTQRALADLPTAVNRATDAPCGTRDRDAAARTLPLGTYAMTVRRTDPVARYDAMKEDFAPGDPTVRFKMIIDRNRLRLEETTAAVSGKVGFDYAYSVLRDRVVFDDDEDHLSMRWAADGKTKTLRFSDIQSSFPSDVVFAAHPWVRVG